MTELERPPTSTPDDEPRRTRPYAAAMSESVPMGIALGAGIGAALGNIAVGIGVGLAIGATIGAARARPQT